MNEFKWYQFSAMWIDKIRPYFKGYDESYTQEVYKRWTHDFERRKGVFYTAQLTNHRMWAEREFMRFYDLDPEYGTSYYISEGLRGEFNEFMESRGVWAHEDFVRSEHRYANERIQREGKMFVTTKDIVDDWQFWMESPNPNPHFFEPLLDAIWFNDEVNNNAETQKVLRSMPYPDYLLTDHWKRVRAAMMLLHRARCQTMRCEGMDGAWMGDEFHMHIHHVSYKNRGNERYSDLRMVCDECHKSHHNGTPLEFSEEDLIMFAFVERAIRDTEAS